MGRPFELGIQNNLLLWADFPHQRVQFRIQVAPYRTAFTKEPQCHLWTNIHNHFHSTIPFRPPTATPFIVLYLTDECTEKTNREEKDGYMWGCGLRPHPHIYRTSSRNWPFFSGFTDISGKQKPPNRERKDLN